MTEDKYRIYFAYRKDIPCYPRPLPDMPGIVRQRLGEIKDTPTLTSDEKKKWMTVIISLFEDEIIFSSESLENLVTKAEKLLSSALPSEYATDNEKIDISYINEEIVKAFKKSYKEQRHS